MALLFLMSQTNFNMVKSDVEYIMDIQDDMHGFYRRTEKRWWETEPCKMCKNKDCGIMPEGYCLCCLNKIVKEWEISHLN